MHWDSRFYGIHAVSITGAADDHDEVKESLMYVRSIHSVGLGKDDYFWFSIDVMLLRTHEGYEEHEANYLPNYVLYRSNHVLEVHLHMAH